MAKPLPKRPARDHWFHDKTPEQKKAYIAKHPNSIYAKPSARQRAMTAHLNRTPEEKALHLTQQKERERARSAKHHEIINRIEAKRHDPAEHASRQKNYESAIESLTKKVEAANKKIEKLKAKVADQKAKGVKFAATAVALREEQYKVKQYKQSITAKKASAKADVSSHKAYNRKKK